MDEIEPFELATDSHVFVLEAKKHLVGRTIVGVYYQHIYDQVNDWRHIPVVLKLDDGQEILPMRCKDGSDGGALATSYDTIPVIPERPVY